MPSSDFEQNSFNLLFVGDLIGRVGRRVLRHQLPGLRQEFSLHAVVANAENAAGGFGVTEDVVKEIQGLGVDVLTTGNHVWDKKEGVACLDRYGQLLRPLNYPPGVPGQGSVTGKVGQWSYAVLNLEGRAFMRNLECPFRAADACLAALPEDVKMILVDFHAETTSEKVALGRYLDGRVSMVCGTHTHVQTADERLLPGGTAYITDVGMTGPMDSVIGSKTEAVVQKFLTQMPAKLEVAKGEPALNAVMVQLDPQTGKAFSITRIWRYI